MEAMQKEHQNERNSSTRSDQIADGVNSWHVWRIYGGYRRVLRIEIHTDAVANLEALELAVGGTSGGGSRMRSAESRINILKALMVVWEQTCDRALCWREVTRDGTGSPSKERAE